MDRIGVNVDVRMLLGNLQGAKWSDSTNRGSDRAELENKCLQLFCKVITYAAFKH